MAEGMLWLYLNDFTKVTKALQINETRNENGSLRTQLFGNNLSLQDSSVMLQPPLHAPAKSPGGSRSPLTFPKNLSNIHQYILNI